MGRRAGKRGEELRRTRADRLEGLIRRACSPQHWHFGQAEHVFMFLSSASLLLYHDFRSPHVSLCTFFTFPVLLCSEPRG